MKKLLTLALALVALAVFSGLGVAQQKAEEKKPPAVPAPRTYAPGDAHYGSTPEKEISGIESEALKAQPGTEMKQPTPGPSPARAACEAGCRQDNQGNSAAIEACYRRCGGPEATPARQLGQPPSGTPGGPQPATGERGVKGKPSDLFIADIERDFGKGTVAFYGKAAMEKNPAYIRSREQARQILLGKGGGSGAKMKIECWGVHNYSTGDDGFCCRASSNGASGFACAF